MTGNPSFSRVLLVDRRVVTLRCGRHERHVGCFGDFSGFDLVAHLADHFGAWPHEGETGIFDCRRELGVFRQEAVAWMDGVAASLLCGRQHLVDVEIAFCRCITADRDGFVGERAMQGVPVGVGVNSNRFNAKVSRGADNAARDF